MEDPETVEKILTHLDAKAAELAALRRSPRGVSDPVLRVVAHAKDHVRPVALLEALCRPRKLALVGKIRGVREGRLQPDNEGNKTVRIHKAFITGLTVQFGTISRNLCKRPIRRGPLQT
jgi:hypothetical protein